MKELLFDKFVKHAILRVTFWGSLAITLLTLPNFLFQGMFYAILAYMLVNGIWGIADFIRESSTSDHVHKEKMPLGLRYFSLVVSVLQVAVVIHSIIFSYLMIKITPVYLGGLLILKAILYFIIALWADTFMQRGLLAALSGIVFLAAVADLIFTFGFGIGGIKGLTKVSAASLLFVCFYELAAYYIYRKNQIID